MIRRFALIAAVFALTIAHLPVQAASMPRFMLTIGGAFLRAQPALTAPLVAPVFSDRAYTVIARTADNVWLQLQSSDQPNDAKAGWILSSLGRSGDDVSTLPIAPTPAFATAKRSTVAKPSSAISAITPQMKKLYREAVKAGHAPNLFAVVGDCNSEPDAYWWRLSAGTFDVSKYPELQPIVEQFKWSFTRGSAAAKGGFHSASMFDPAWADPATCKPGEGPLDCELRFSNASIAFVSLGTGDTFAWKDFETNYERIITSLLESKVVPVLVTKADDLESHQAGAPPGAINDAVRKLSKQYGVPLIDFWQATRPLPDYGMRWEGNENFHMSPAGSDMRILLTLQTLDAITR
jgi:hypothetical protein